VAATLAKAVWEKDIGRRRWAREQVDLAATAVVVDEV